MKILCLLTPSATDGGSWEALRIQNKNLPNGKGIEKLHGFFYPLSIFVMGSRIWIQFACCGVSAGSLVPRVAVGGGVGSLRDGAW